MVLIWGDHVDGPRNVFREDFHCGGIDSPSLLFEDEACRRMLMGEYTGLDVWRICSDDL